MELRLIWTVQHIGETLTALRRKKWHKVSRSRKYHSHQTVCRSDTNHLNLDRPQRPGYEISLERPAHRNATSNPPPAEVAPRPDELISLDRPVKLAAVAHDLPDISLELPGCQSTFDLNRPGSKPSGLNLDRPVRPPAAAMGESILNLDRPNRPPPNRPP